MKFRFNGSALACFVFVWLTCSAAAQVIQPIYYFTNSSGNPRNLPTSLTLGPDGWLYGSTEFGGTSAFSDFGTEFKVSTSGDLEIIANLGSHEDNPYASLTLGPDGNFYGTTSQGGPVGAGSVFQMSTDGTVNMLFGFKVAIWSGSAVTNLDGATPRAGLTLGPNGSYYGTTTQGGTNGGGGTVFKITTNGTLTTLVALGNPNGSADPNAYGADPVGRMALGPDGNFYGTTYLGGYQGDGTVFRMTPDGAFATIFRFGETNGSHPDGDLVLGPDQCLYGTTLNGGSGGYGTVFKITTNGLMTTVVNFDYKIGGPSQGGLTLAPDGSFYGTVAEGAYANTAGGVFRVTTNGVLTMLAYFGGTDGSDPESPPIIGPDGNLYGTTFTGGPDPNGVGVIYRINIAPPATNQPPIAIDRNAEVVLHLATRVGSTNRLWSTTNPALPMSQWQVLATNVAVNGFFDFQDTNAGGSHAKFYRLSTP